MMSTHHMWVVFLKAYNFFLQSWYTVLIGMDDVSKKFKSIDSFTCKMQED